MKCKIEKNTVQETLILFCFINLSAKWVVFAGLQKKDVHSAA